MTARILLLATATVALAGAATPVYPLPHRFAERDALTSLSSTATIQGSDQADTGAVASLKARVAQGDSKGKITRIIIGERGDPSVAGFFDGIPETSGAYRLQVTADQLVIAGHDGRGTCYGIRSLEQLLDADGSPATLPEVDITDWPDVPHRGAVEGFYGTPWSHENRLSLIRFFGIHKLNTYIYGPKDDPFHSSPNWRTPYPSAESEKIRELAATSRANQVDFVWAIHPGKDIRWTDADFNAVKDKFEAMYALGVRSFAVFFDDISGEGTKADQQARLLNFLQEEFVAGKPDVTPLIMCPTEYNKSWANPKPGTYLDILGDTLNPAIQVMWTGNSVVADLDRESMEWINRRIRRNAYIWWNFPVTDYARNHLLLGPVYGNGNDIANQLGGFVSNPMERAEASKIALFGVACYTWNVSAYDAQTAWRAAIHEQMPGVEQAFEMFCVHNSDLGPNGHGYRRDESVEFAPVAAKFLAAFRLDRTADATAVRDELERVSKAPAEIRAGATNTSLIAEISPWLDAFEQLGIAGVAALDADAMMRQGNAAKSWPLLAEANSALARMTEIDRTHNRNPYQPGISTGSLVVTPLVRELVDTTSARFLGQLSGRPLFRPIGITSTSEPSSLPLMLDGKEDTFFYCKTVQKAGDWFGIDLGGINKVSQIHLVQGRDDGDHDRVHQGEVEGSEDGESWQSIAPVVGSRMEVDVDPPRNIRFVRMRVTQPGSPEKPDLWTAIRSFEINPAVSAAIRTDIAAFKKQPVRTTAQEIAIFPMLEVHPFPPGKYLGLVLPQAIKVIRFEVDLKTASPDKSWVLEATANGSAWKSIPTKSVGSLMTADLVDKIIAVRVRNTSNETPSVTLAKFVLTLDSTASAGPLAALTDGRLDTSAEIQPGAATVIPVSSGESPSSVILLGNPGSKAAAGVEAIIGGKRRPLGKLQGDFCRFELPQGSTGIVIIPAGNAASIPIREIVWSIR